MQPNISFLPFKSLLLHCFVSVSSPMLPSDSSFFEEMLAVFVALVVFTVVVVELAVVLVVVLVVVVVVVLVVVLVVLVVVVVVVLQLLPGPAITSSKIMRPIRKLV